MLSANSYPVLPDTDGNLQWMTDCRGKQVGFDKDPQSTVWQRLTAGFIRLLPIEDQL